MHLRLAVAVEEVNSTEIVAEHFGRCSKFSVCEFDEQKNIIKTESFFNPLIGEHGGTCQLPGYIKQFNINTIIAGGMGQKAITNFEANDIKVITAPGILYDEVIKLFIEGKLAGYQACLHEHHH